MSLKIYEVAYSEDTVHHKRFEAENAEMMLSLSLRKISINTVGMLTELGGGNTGQERVDT
jgi:hypothetical protein